MEKKEENSLLLSEKQKDEKDEFKRGVKAQKKASRVYVTIASVLCLAVGGVGGALIYKGVRNSQEDALVTARLLEIYNYLKDDWLYAGDYDDFQETFSEYMIEGMLDNDNDPYTFYTPTYDDQGLDTSGSGAYGFSSYYSAGVSSGVSYGGLLLTKLVHGEFEESGFKVGDLLIAFKKDGDSDFTYFDEVPANKVSSLIKPDKDGDLVSFKYIRDGAIGEASSTTGTYTQDSASLVSESTGTKHILTLKVSTFLGTKTNTPSNLVKGYIDTALNNGNIDELVLDCRSNGGGYTENATNLAKLFLPKGKIIFSEGDNEGNLETTYYQDSNPTYSTDQVKNIRIILNGGSASATELFAKALSENDMAKIYGRTSYGKGIEQAVITLKSGGVLRLTTKRIYGPDGTTYEGVGKAGIVPDYETNDYYSYTSYAIGTPYVEDSYRLTYAQEQAVTKGLATLGDPYLSTYSYEEMMDKFQEANGLEQTGEYDTKTLYRYYSKVVKQYYDGEDNEVSKVINYQE